jgi:hypothetical protein
MILTLILFSIANLILAYLDAHKIIKGNTINHLLNACIYIGIVAVPFLLFKNWFLIAALLFNRLLVFNIMLSLFRGLNWSYISPSPISVTDKIAKKIFSNNGKLMYAVYAVVFIVLTIISFIWTR